jgi:hypothetical protein
VFILYSVHILLSELYLSVSHTSCFQFIPNQYYIKFLDSGGYSSNSGNISSSTSDSYTACFLLYLRHSFSSLGCLVSDVSLVRIMSLAGCGIDRGLY